MSWGLVADHPFEGYARRERSQLAVVTGSSRTQPPMRNAGSFLFAIILYKVLELIAVSSASSSTLSALPKFSTVSMIPIPTNTETREVLNLRAP